MKALRLTIVSALLALAAATPAAAADGDLFVDGCLSVDVVPGCSQALPSRPAAIAESPDGRQVYVALQTNDQTGFTGLQIFDRNASTGALTARAGVNGCFAPNATTAPCQLIAGLESLSSPSDLAVAPDGKTLYMTVIGGPGGLLSFRRNAVTGALEYLDCYGGGAPCTPMEPFEDGYGLAVSPNSANVYVRTSDGLALFDRDPVTLRVSQRPGPDGCLIESAVAGCTQVDGLNGASRTMSVSPDGSSLYVPFALPGGVTRLDRVLDGRLPSGRCISVTGWSGTAPDRCDVGPLELSLAWAAVASPDGKSVYVGAEAGLTAYHRDPATGALTLAECFGDREGCTPVEPGILGVIDVAVTPDGSEVIAAPHEPDALVAFQRDAATLALTRRPGTRGCVSASGSDGLCQRVDLFGSTHLAIDPGGLSVYAANEGGLLVTLSRDFAPVCQSRTIDVPHNTPVVVPLSCTDRNNDAIRFVKAASPTGGQLGDVNQATRSVLYTPVSGFIGTDTFTYRGEGRGVASAPATITLRVAGPAPVAPAGAAPPPSSGTTVTPQPSAPERIVVTVAFAFNSEKNDRTRFRRLSVQGVPRGATVRVTCKGKGCPKRKVKGKRRAVTFTKRNASGTVRLKPWVRKWLPTGTVLRIAVTKPGSIGMVKTLTVRSRRAPRIRTTCLQPGSATRRVACR